MALYETWFLASLSHCIDREAATGERRKSK
jgi:hypothetical protein